MIDKEAVIRIRTAVEDLSFLKGEWRQDVDDASLRRASGPMRRLLVDGDLQRAWHDLGFDKQPIVRRHLVIKYVANKLGGIHLDPKRDLKKDEEVGFSLLDQIADTYQVAGKQAIYFELLSIGQSISASPDVDRFLEVGRAATLDSRSRGI
jgi:hypothetical protein